MSGRRWVRHGLGPSTWTLEHRGRTEAALQWQGQLEAYRLTFAGENWTIDVAGSWQRRIVIQDAGQHRYDGTLQHRGLAISGHPSGPVSWWRVGRWRATYELRDEGGRVLARFHAKRREAPVQVETGLAGAIPLLAAGLVAHLTATGDTSRGTILSALGSTAAD